MNEIEKITLTNEQEKAFKSLERAYKKCKDSGIMFYTVLATLNAVNGNEIEDILTNDTQVGILVDDILDLTFCINDDGFAGFADDDHYAVLK